MGKVNALFMEEMERRAEEYMLAHPDADPADADEYAHSHRRNPNDPL